MYNVFFADINTQRQISPYADPLIESLNGPASSQKLIVTILTIGVIIFAFCMVALALHLKSEEKGGRLCDYDLSDAEFSKLFD